MRSEETSTPRERDSDAEADARTGGDRIGYRTGADDVGERRRVG